MRNTDQMKRVSTIDRGGVGFPAATLRAWLGRGQDLGKWLKAQGHGTNPKLKAPIEGNSPPSAGNHRI